MTSTIKDFFVGISWKADDAARSRAERSVAAFEKVVVAAEARVARAQADNAKASVQIALQKEADLARQILAEKKAAATVVTVEAEKAKALDAGAKAHRGYTDTVVRGMSAMTLAAGALGIAVVSAVTKVTGVFDTLHFVSARTGTSAKNIQALQYAFGQVGSTGQSASAAIESFSRQMRTNPGIGGFVKGLGVATHEGGKARDTLEVLSDSIDAILKKEPYHTGAQMAELLGLSEDQFETFARYRKEIKAYREEYSKTAQTFGLDAEKAAKSSDAFNRSLRTLGMQAGVLGQKLLITLAPTLERIATAMADWVKSNPERLEIILTKVSDAALALATGIGNLFLRMTGSDGDDFLKRWDAFAVRVERVAGNVERIVTGLVKIIGFVERMSGTRTVLGDPLRAAELVNGLLPGGGGVGGGGRYNPLTDAGPPGTVPKDDRTLKEKILPKMFGGRDAPGAGDGSRSFRNHNPGNLKFGDFARSMGATGADAAGFAVFPDYATGRKAQEALLFNSKSYKDLTIGQAIARYAPGSDGNDPAGYANQMARAVGASVDTKLSDLTSEQRGRFLDAQQRKEGWIPAAAGASGGKQVAGDIAPINGVGGVLQRQGGARFRRQDISDTLRAQLNAASIAAGVNAEIYSGGQSEGGGTGSHRHDHGGAADLKLFTLGPNGEKRYLSMGNDADRSLMEKFIRASVKAGANGVGAGPGYMGDGIHIGGGSPAAWGAGGSSANAPEWVTRAHREGMADRAQAKTRAAPLSSIRLPQLALSPGGLDMKSLGGQPMGSSSIVNNTSNSADRSLTMNNSFNTTVHGSDAAEGARAYTKLNVGLAGQVLENAQKYVR